jgi:hypothetical protein
MAPITDAANQQGGQTSTWLPVAVSFLGSGEFADQSGVADQGDANQHGMRMPQ